MPKEEINYFLEALERFKGTFKSSMSSIPLHFDMLNATPYSLSKEGNSNLGSINRVKRSLNVQN